MLESSKASLLLASWLPSFKPPSYCELPDTWYRTLFKNVSENRKLLKTTIEHYRVDRREIAFIKFIFEAYDGIAGLRTTDPSRGIIVFHIAPGCQEPVQRILQDLKKQILIERLESVPSETDLI